MCTHLENKVLNDKNNDVKINLTNDELDKNNQVFYGLTNDYAFKKIFSQEINLRYLLYNFFNMNPKEIAVKNNELLKDYYVSKAGIVDLFLELDNENVILELQNVNEYNIEERVLFYSGCVIANHSLDRGHNYKELKPLKVLVILNYNYQEDNIEIAKLIKNNKVLTNKLEFKFFDLTKANKNEEIIQLCNIKEFNEMENFSIKLDIENEELLLDIASTLKKFNESKEEREKMEDIARMMMEETCHYENAYIVGCEEGEKRGMSQGILKGISQGTENVARNLLKKNFDIDTIMDVTKLSKEKILSLK